MVLFSIILLCPIGGYSQNKIYFNLELDPFCIPFNAPLNYEKGLGYYSVMVNGLDNYTGNVNMSWHLFNEFGLRIGIGIHNFRYQVNYNILNPLDESMTFINNYRFFHTTDIGPILGITFAKGKIQISTGLNLLIQHLEIYQSHNSELTYNYFIDPLNQQSATLRIREDITFSRASSYNLFYIKVGYSFAKNFFFNISYENSFSNGLPALYELEVIGNTINTTDEDHLLNDFAFLNKYSSINFGISYNFELMRKRIKY